jgi:hypothetical protein
MTNTNIPTENTQPSLGIQDLKVAADIINICTQRGAFRANELSAVGLLYDRLTAFLAASEPAADAAGPAPAPAAEAGQE